MGLYGRVGLCTGTPPVTPPTKEVIQARIDEEVLVISSDGESEMFEGEGGVRGFVGGEGCKRKVVCISRSP